MLINIFAKGFPQNLYLHFEWIYMDHMHSVPIEARRGCRVPWDCSYRWFVAPCGCWEYEFPEKAGCALKPPSHLLVPNSFLLSPTLSFFFKNQTGFYRI